MSESIRIQTLSQTLANQIAAGEVIERPASVLKELMENSIDAGATEIIVKCTRSGKQSIRVQDNGHGIHPDDMALALARHATSKISQQSDLSAIATLGFRGEALASITACAHVKLASRHTNNKQGYTLSTTPTALYGQPEICAHPQGTTVHVSHLFANLPAREKFLRSDRTEYLHIEEIFLRLALSQPSIAFRLIHDGRVMKQLPINTDSPMIDRVRRIMGATFIETAQSCQTDNLTLSMTGFLGRPADARSQSDQQHCFLNGRVIKDKLVYHAIRQAYSPWLHPGRYPSYVCYLTLNRATVDVNVHPTKHEVRFNDARTVHDVLFQQVTTLFQATDEHNVAFAATQEDMPVTAIAADTPPSAVSTPSKSLQPTVNQTVTTPVLESRVLSSSQAISTEGEYMGSFADQWLLLKQVDCLKLLHLHPIMATQAACALNYALSREKIAVSPCLQPAVIPLEEHQCEQLLANPLPRKLGVIFESFGDKQVILRALPHCLRYARPSKLAEQFLLTTDENTQRCIERLACLAAPSSIAELSATDKQSVLASASHEKRASQCACGYLTWRAFTGADLSALMQTHD